LNINVLKACICIWQK